MALILALVFAAASHLTQLSSSMILSLLQVIFVLFITLMGFQTVMDSLEPNFSLKLFLEPSESFEVSSWVSVLLSAHKVEPLLPSRLQALHWLPLQVADLWSCTPCSYSSLRYSAPWGPTWTCSYLPKCVAYTVFRSQCLSRSPSGVWASIDGGQPTQASSICVPDFAAKQSGFASLEFCLWSLCLILHFYSLFHSGLDVSVEIYELRDLLAKLILPSLRLDIHSGTIKHLTNSANSGIADVRLNPPDLGRRYLPNVFTLHSPTLAREYKSVILNAYLSFLALLVSNMIVSRAIINNHLLVVSYVSELLLSRLGIYLRTINLDLGALQLITLFACPWVIPILFKEVLRHLLSFVLHGLTLPEHTWLSGHSWISLLIWDIVIVRTYYEITMAWTALCCHLIMSIVFF